MFEVGSLKVDMGNPGLGERTLNLKCLQRAEDREKIRRLVFGEDGENTETS
jgi:hypothetical protein